MYGGICIYSVKSIIDYTPTTGPTFHSKQTSSNVLDFYADLLHLRKAWNFDAYLLEYINKGFLLILGVVSKG